MMAKPELRYLNIWSDLYPVHTKRNAGATHGGKSAWWIRDVYPGSRILIFTHPGSRISDPGSKNSNKRERWKKICYHTFFVVTNFTKLNTGIMLFLKNFGPSFYPKNFQYAPKYMGLGLGIRDPGSGIRKKPIPDPGSRIQGSKGTGSRIRIRNTG